MLNLRLVEKIAVLRESIIPLTNKEQFIVDLLQDAMIGNPGDPKHLRNGIPVVIGLIGVKGAGKSTLANHFRGQLNATVISEQQIRALIYWDALQTIAGTASVPRIMQHLLIYALSSHRNVIWDTDCVYLSDQLHLRALALPFTRRVRFAHVICSDFLELQRRVGPQSGPQFNASLVHHYKRSRDERELLTQPWYLQPPIDTASPQWPLFANRFLETTVD